VAGTFKPPDYIPPKPSFRTPLPLPTPPRKGDKPGLPAATDDRRGTDNPPARSTDEKVAAMRAYRRARGLCTKCAEKWSYGHQCSSTVQLHVLQELWELFQLEEEEEEDSSDQHVPDPSGQLCMVLSQAAVTGQEGPKTMCMVGEIQGHSLKVLIDSGSSHTFISAQLAESLQGVFALHSNINVQVADGGRLKCQSELQQAAWTVQGYTFHSELKVLPLQSYDLIVGMDWLEHYSPMKVHCRQKWMAIPYGGKTVVLQGQLPVNHDLAAVQVLWVLDAEVPDAVSEPVPAELQKLLEQYSDIFTSQVALPPSRACDHEIPLIAGARPVNIRAYRYTPAQKDEIERQVKEMLHQGIIQPSSSPFSSPVLLVRKKDNTWRFCVDYRHLNALTIKNKFPVPVIDEFLDELAHASWFTCLDMCAGYHQIKLKHGEEFKTAFQTHSGHYEFRVMAFGLTGGPATFQGAMNTTLAPLLRKCVLVFFDDILVYSRTYEEHVSHVAQVLQLLQQDQWKVKLTKCSFAKRQIAYLGHVISEAGVSTDPRKISAISTWPTPTSVKELRSFLGLAGYYRKFVHHFGVISRPLFDLLKKHTLFVWTTAHDEAFQSLKSALCQAPVLALPDFAKPFAIETYASDLGVGAVLLQQGHPLAFVSKALGPKTRGLSTYEKEYLAILIAVEQWRHYLQHAEFIIHTDQRSLVHLNEQRLNTHWQHKVFTKLLGLQYKIIYKPGATNRVADALSRKPVHDAHCAAVSTTTPLWLDEVLAGYKKDVHAQELITKLCLNSNSVPNYTFQSGLLRYKNRIWIGQNPPLQQSIMQAMHSSALGGHSGVPVTYRRLKQLFAWRGMKAAVHQFVQSCLICQQAKPDRARLPGLLQPVQVPPSAWHTISMDFVEGLPKSGHANAILVVVDKFTKYAHFLPIQHPFTAFTVAKLFMQHVYKLHGMPMAIISDRDRVFTSTLWRELFRLSDTKLQMSSAYHLQSNGQTERVNQCMETYLRCFVHACPSKWNQWLSSAVFWYNSSFHSALGKSPFEALYGYAPRHFGLSATDVAPGGDLATWLREREVMNNLLRQHLLRAQDRMKKQADKHRSE